MALVGLSEGNYHFLAGSGALPFCGGVIADPGYEIVHAVLQQPVPYLDGFRLVEQHLAGLGRPRQALCAVELRVGKQYTRDEFFSPDGFNGRYGALLREWGLSVDGLGSTARTNIALELFPPAEQVMLAFSYTVPAANAPQTFLLSGAAEAGTARPGESTPDALREKTANVLATLSGRLEGLGVGWDQATAIGVYCVHDLWPILRAELLQTHRAAGTHGVHWFHGRPPVQGSELELDARGVRSELRLGM